jgi:nitroreductase
MEFMQIIRTRRSARSFKPDPIPEDALVDMLEAACLAPSPGNCQSWYFGVVTDEQIRYQLAEAAGNQMWIATAPVVIALCSRLRWHLKPVNQNDFGLQVSLTRYGKDFWDYLQSYPNRKRIGALLEEWTVSLAGHQLFLAAVNHGLSACWVGFLDTKKASQILGLPEDVICEFLLPVGYPSEPAKPIDRRQINEVVFYDRWESGPGKYPVNMVSRSF